MPGGLVRGLAMVSVMSLVWSQDVVAHHGVGGVVGPAAAGVGEEMVDGDVGDPLLVGWLAVSDAEDAVGPKTLSVRLSLPCSMRVKMVTDVMGLVTEAMRKRESRWPGCGARGRPCRAPGRRRTGRCG